eukprot:4247324-Pyramimonas_sp.AAC.1
MFSGVAWMSAAARRSSSLATKARFAAGAAYTRTAVARSASNNMCCCSDKTTFDISVVKQSSTHGPLRQSRVRSCRLRP